MTAAEQFLQHLNRQGARYVVVGGSAVAFHGCPRPTPALDLYIEPDIVNAELVSAALRDFGQDTDAMTAENLLANRYYFWAGTQGFAIQAFVIGVTFGELWEHRVEGKIGDEPAHFPCVDDLIAMKEATARKKDLEDVARLREAHGRGGSWF